MTSCPIMSKKVPYSLRPLTIIRSTVMNLYQIFLTIQMVAIPIVYISLRFTTAPYGRHSVKGWGPVINSRLAWILMELPAVLTIAIIYWMNASEIPSINLIFLFIWEFHYVYRTFYFPFRLKRVRNNFPILLVVFAVVFNIINGGINGMYIFHIRPVETMTFFMSAHFVTGLLIFITGFLIHFQSDRIILSLRKDPNDQYAIPEGGLFTYITNPNYFGEFIQWCGWAILTWSVAGLAFALFTLANLLPRAASNHRWYKHTFPEYPAERKIFFPGLY